jgi:hypothetical protein
MATPVSELSREVTQGTSRRSWIAWSAAALGISLFHQFIDFHVGLYGPTALSMSTLQAANALLLSILYAWWLLVVILAAQGNRGAQWSNVVFLIVWVAYFSGFTGLFSTLPPNAYPYHSIAHVGDFAVGAVAAFLSWRSRPYEGRRPWVLPAVSLAILVAQVAASTPLAPR